MERRAEISAHLWVSKFQVGTSNSEAENEVQNCPGPGWDANGLFFLMWKKIIPDGYSPLRFFFTFDIKDSIFPGM